MNLFSLVVALILKSKKNNKKIVVQVFRYFLGKHLKNKFFPITIKAKTL